MKAKINSTDLAISEKVRMERQKDKKRKTKRRESNQSRKYNQRAKK